MQLFFGRSVCCVKGSVPVDVIFQELSVIRWHILLWPRVTSFWSAMFPDDSATLSCMMPLLLLSVGAGLAGLHRFSDALLNMGSPAIDWQMLLLSDPGGLWCVRVTTG